MTYKDGCDIPAVFIHADGTIRFGKTNTAMWVLYALRPDASAPDWSNGKGEICFKMTGVPSCKGDDIFGPAKTGPWVYLEAPWKDYEAHIKSIYVTPGASCK